MMVFLLLGFYSNLAHLGASIGAWVVLPKLITELGATDDPAAFRKLLGSRSVWLITLLVVWFVQGVLQLLQLRAKRGNAWWHWVCPVCLLVMGTVVAIVFVVDHPKVEEPEDKPKTYRVPVAVRDQSKALLIAALALNSVATIASLAQFWLWIRMSDASVVPVNGAAATAFADMRPPGGASGGRVLPRPRSAFTPQEEAEIQPSGPKTMRQTNQPSVVLTVGPNQHKYVIASRVTAIDAMPQAP